MTTVPRPFLVSRRILGSSSGETFLNKSLSAGCKGHSLRTCSTVSSWPHSQLWSRSSTKWHIKKTFVFKGVCLYETVKVAVSARVMSSNIRWRRTRSLCEAASSFSGLLKVVTLNFSTVKYLLIKVFFLTKRIWRIKMWNNKKKLSWWFTYF